MGSRVETVVVSDLHLTEAQEAEPRRPFWMAHKRRALFCDADLGRLLDHVEEHAEGDLELVLNGDIFDFDSVLQVPADRSKDVSWLARLRGLESEEWMSLYKMERIIADHEAWFARLATFIERGGRVVFVIGNHDAELCWPSVQALIRSELGLGPESVASDGDDSLERLAPLAFCHWFYLSDDDTFISHGHQYDPNCVAPNPIDPLIEVHGRPRVRIPFGDLAGRYMLNGMGYFNPHSNDNYIMSGRQYLSFFVRYMMWSQPLLLWTWFWGALVTYLLTLRDHLMPAMRDPLGVDAKVADVARRARATPRMVRQLHALSVAPAASNPVRIARELWLDRAVLLIAIVYAAWQIVLLVNFAWPISPLWVLVPLLLMLPPYFAYSATVAPTVFKKPLLDEERAWLISSITGARRVVFGHTHEPMQTQVGPLEYVNGGFWSPAFAEPDCKTRIGTQTFVWISAPGSSPEGSSRAEGESRVARLCEWPPGGSEPRPFVRRHEPAELPPASSGTSAPGSSGTSAPESRGTPAPEQPTGDDSDDRRAARSVVA